MLESFFISKVRVKILRLYLEHQQNSFHVRDIVRQTKEEINAVRRELINLEKAGLFRREPKFNRVYYVLNENYPLLSELRAMIFKEFGLGGSIIKERENLGNVTFAVLSSLYIHNKPMDQSELDLLIVGDQVAMERLNIIVKTAELDNQREINYAVLSSDQFELQMKRREGYLKNFLDKSKLFLIGNEDEFLT